jgi:deoxyribodipyrimidine photo-lyase
MRVFANHALTYAIELANQHHLPVVVYFGITPNYPSANLRHYTFMLEGLEEVARDLEQRKISFVIKLASPEVGMTSLLPRAHTVVMDFAYLRTPRSWRRQVYQQAKELQKPVVIVESDLIVPVRVTSDKEEYAAATIRKKVWKHVPDFLDDPSLPDVQNVLIRNIPSDFDITDWRNVVLGFIIDHSVKPSPIYKGGYSQAILFLERYLSKYVYQNEELPSDPSLDASSKLSMYLHFGQISPLDIYQRTLDYSGAKTPQMQANIDSLFEQLVVRRELAFNFVYYNEGYDQFDSMTYAWAYQTMKEHENDPREVLYTLADYENASTHDPYFNAAMLEMIHTGFMHNYMRMYWAKKIIEWSPSYEEAYRTSVYLDDKYFLDGRDPNGYTGVAWCYGKHDRAWTERSVFGKLRYMNAGGLERKFKINDYVKRWQSFAKSLQ